MKNYDRFVLSVILLLLIMMLPIETVYAGDNDITANYTLSVPNVTDGIKGS